MKHLILICLCGLVCGTASAQIARPTAVDPEEFHADYREAEAAFLEKFTLSFDVIQSIDPLDREQGTKIQTIDVTQDDPTRLAWKSQELDRELTPTYRDPESWMYAQHDDEGRMMLQPTLSIWALLSPDQNHEKTDFGDEMSTVAPDGTVGTMQVVSPPTYSRYDLHDVHYVHAIVRQAQMAFGRGFSRLLSKVVTVSRGKDGLTRVIGRGFLGSRNNYGEWKITLTDEFLVREATFYHGANRAYHVTTDGLVQIGELAVAESGKSVSGNPATGGTLAVAEFFLQDGAIDFDRRMYRKIVGMFKTENREQNRLESDHRGGLLAEPETRQYVDGELMWNMQGKKSISVRNQAASAEPVNESETPRSRN